MKNKFAVVLSTLSMLLFIVSAKAVTIQSPVPFMGMSGDIFTLSDGSMYEVGIGEFNYLYSYYPDVVVFNNTITIKDKIISVRNVSNSCSRSWIQSPRPFMGMSGDIFTLSDGSMYEVGIGEFNYLYSYYPDVIICDSNSLRVDGEKISVSRVWTTVTAIPVNHAPTGSPIGFDAGNEDTNYILTASGLLNGFSDADGDSLFVTNLTATHGKITTNSDGTWLLTPDANYSGIVQLSYGVTDNKGGSKNGVINFVLNPVNDLPTGYVAISGAAWEQGTTLTASNTLADVDGLGVISYQWLRAGSVISAATQTTYLLTTADVGKAISVKVSYTDLKGTTENVLSSATGFVAAQAVVNRPPTGSSIGFGAGNEDVNYVLTASGLLNGFSDADGDSLFVTNLTATHGKITTNSDGTWLLTPDANYSGIVQLSYGVTDNKGGSKNGVINFVLNPVIDSNDTHEGSLGADTLVGTNSDDTYIINNKGDKIIEKLDAGTDTVRSSITYALGNNLENLELIGVAKINATGNALDNWLSGNDGNNVLNGMAGNDILIGGLGSDKLTGGKGMDTFEFKMDDFFPVDENGDYIFNKSVDTITDFNLKEGDILNFDGLQFYPDLASAKADEPQLFYVKGTIYLNIDTTALKYSPVAIIKLTGNPKVNADFTDFDYPI